MTIDKPFSRVHDPNALSRLDAERTSVETRKYITKSFHPWIVAFSDGCPICPKFPTTTLRKRRIQKVRKYSERGREGEREERVRD